MKHSYTLLILALLAAMPLCSVAQSKKQLKEQQQRNIVIRHKADSLQQLANRQYNTLHFVEAAKIGSEALKLYRQVLPTSDPNLMTLINNQALIHMRATQHAEAIELSQEVMELKRRHFGDNSNEYTNAIQEHSKVLFNASKYTEAVNMQLRALDIIEHTFGESTLERANALENTAMLMRKTGKIDETLNYQKQAVATWQEMGASYKPQLLKAMDVMSRDQVDMGDYVAAFKTIRSVVDLWRDLKGPLSEEYANALNSLASRYNDNGEYEEALSVGLLCLKTYSNIGDSTSNGYLTARGNLAIYYDNLGNYVESVEQQRKVVETVKALKGDDNLTYAKELGRLAERTANMGDYNKAIEMQRQVLKINERANGVMHANYAQSLSNMAIYYFGIGNTDEAIRLEQRRKDILYQTVGNGHDDYAQCLSLLSAFQAQKGNHKEALLLQEEASQILRQLHGEKNLNYIQSLTTMAMRQANVAQYDEAISTTQTTIELYKETVGVRHANYFQTFSTLAGYYAMKGDGAQAISIGRQALDALTANLGENHPDCATAMANLANFYALRGNHQEAIKLKRKAMNTIRNTWGESSTPYATALSELSWMYYAANNKEEATKTRIASTDVTTDIILSTFADMSSRDRANFWQLYANRYEQELPQFAWHVGGEQLIEAAFDAALLSKGLLLNAEIEMSRLLLESGNQAVVDKYTKLQGLRTLLNKQYEMPLDQRADNLEELENNVKQMERELIAMSKDYGDYTKNLRIGWRDVQRNLRDDDIAVEFLSFTVSADSTLYCALTLRKDDVSPQITALCTEQQFQKSTADREMLVWQPIKERLNGVKRVFFSPSGELYRTGIEYLPMMDSYDCYRLSSTRELAKSHEHTTISQAILYGGLSYYMNNAPSPTPQQPAGDEVNRGAVEGLRPLPGSKKEVEEIAKLIEAQEVETSLAIGREGTEESFKQLSGKRTGIIHLSTHGFYESNQQKNASLATASPDQTVGGLTALTSEEIMLNRSGLYLSGAAYHLYANNLDLEGEDGILTAREISRLDLRGLDLVVLSACETALGDVSGEGVFGLQRGFKKAGANTLLMSLWKVDDRATQLLMTEFYRQFTLGKSKREAFREAQRYLKTCENGRYNDPKFWAAFVLLDAI